MTAWFSNNGVILSTHDSMVFKQQRDPEYSQQHGFSNNIVILSIYDIMVFKQQSDPEYS